MLWRILDDDSSGFATLNEFTHLIYRIELLTWPDLTGEQLATCVKKLNEAANYWHRSGGNWFKIFSEIDADDSGNISFDELLQCVRGPFPGLGQSSRDISEAEIQGMWKALDDNHEIEVHVAKFMGFMRYHGNEWHKYKKKHEEDRVHKEMSTQFQPGVQRRITAVSSKLSTCGFTDLRRVALTLEESMKASWSIRGVHTITTSTTHGTALGNWNRFFEDMKVSRAKKLTHVAFNRAIVDGLGCHCVTDTDLQVLWNYLAQGKKEIFARDIAAKMYRFELEDWPSKDDNGLREVVADMNAAAHRRHYPGTGVNWAKMYNLVDPSGAGHISYMHLKRLIRHAHTLSIPSEVISDNCVRALWKALDSNASGRIFQAEFMAFMRKYGPQAFKSSQPHIRRSWFGLCGAGNVKDEVPAAPQLSQAELCDVGKRLTVAVQAWLSTIHYSIPIGPGSPGLWSQLISFVSEGKNGRLRFAEFQAATMGTLHAGTSVSLDELRAFWHLVDDNASGEVSAEEIDSTIYA
jgi:Ca2+-binding EF-hand superfamily protein